MQPSFVRNLDSGMRRLGYLEVLICDCIIKGEQTSGKYLGESLWSWAKENQPEFLDKIGKNRKLNREEVGKITEKTASRYVKYATEIGLLTKGTEKELTDAGRLFQNYRKHRFMIENNPGQQILLLDALLTKDKLIFSRIVDLFAVSNFLKKTDIFSWFVNECIPSILNEIKESDEDLSKRLRKIPHEYLKDKKGKRKAYDSIKHIMDTRIENLVDLGLIEKTPTKQYAPTNLLKIINEELKKSNVSQQIVFSSMSRHYKITKEMPETQLVKNYIKQYEELTIDPIGTVDLSTLHMRLFIDNIINQKFTITSSMIDDLEEKLFKKHYGDVVFLRNRDGKLTHINIDSNVVKKMQKGKI